MTIPAGAAPRPAVPLAATILLVGTLGSIYIVSQFLRNSIGVIAPNLASELSLSAAEIGLLSSTFFFAFAAAQIPLGIALDRYGPKTCMLVCAGIAIAGAILFAIAVSTPWLVTGRVLMGLGSCCYLMAPLAVYARRYSPHRFATLVGVQIGLGSIGTLLATAPLAWSVTLIGWRNSFIAVAGVMLLAGLLVAWVVRDDGPSPQQSGSRESLRDSISGMLEVFRTGSVGTMFVVNLSAYSSFVLVVGLWGGPYLTHIYGYSLTGRGDMLLMAVVAQIVASFVYGPTDRLFRSHKIPVIAGSLLTSAMLGYAALAGRIPESGLLAWFIAFGAVSAYATMLIAHGKSLFPPHLVGRGMTVLNIGLMGGVFLTQTISGFVIDFFPQSGGAYALDAYRMVFGLQAVFVLFACLLYLRARDPWREGLIGAERSTGG